MTLDANAISRMFNDAVRLHQGGKVREALSLYEKLLPSMRQNADLLYLLGSAYLQLKQLKPAVEHLQRSLALKPGNAAAHNNLGTALLELSRRDEALASFDKAVAIKPDYVEAFNSRGNALKELGRLDEALASYDKALLLAPDHPGAHNNRGNALKELKRLDEALAAYDRALRLKPDYAEAYNNRGYALKDLNRFEDALASFDKALKLKPDYAEAHNNRGNVLLDIKHPDEALAAYDRALTSKPDYADAYNSRGYALKDMGRLEDAVESFDKALKLRPDYKFLLGAFLHTKMELCDWSSLSENLDRLVESVSQSKPVTTPWALLGLVDSLELQLAAAKIQADTKYPEQHVLGPVQRRPPGGKIRIGYYSADFHTHATTFLMAELFEAHDRSKFEFFAFSFGPPSDDAMRQRVSAAFDRFIDVRDNSDRAVAQLSRELGIDIAVDLKGYTQDCRPGIFAERAAPIQVGYLGYPGTMGAEYIDYLVADKTIVPPECRSGYSEKIVRLPHSYQVNDSKRKISDRRFTKDELGLPDGGFVFCCFNKSYKILPATFDGWMRILKAVDRSSLWLFEESPTAAKNLRREADTRGVDGSRLVFAERMPLDEHLARHRLADLFLDTLPCNAHTTASDALWAGLPVLTCAGRSFASRVAASLLNAVGLPELVARTQDDYEAMAIELARDADKLRALKDKLAHNRLTSPLFDGQRFARHLEASYLAMFERYEAGRGPSDIDIDG